MKIYKLSAIPDKYELLVLRNNDDWKLLRNKFIGSEISDWAPVEMEVYSNGKDRLPLPDFPNLSPSIPVFSAHALDALAPLLEKCGKSMLLGRVNGKDYFAFNITCVADALDEEASTTVRFKDSGRVMRVERYTFKSGKLPKCDLFKIPQTQRSEAFVSEQFVAAVNASNLSGFLFEMVWDSQAT